MPTSAEIIPMPKWSVPIGCTKFAIAIIILAFTAASIAVWGGYPAFCFSLFTASTSLVVFGYYLTALSFNPQVYNKYVILALETHLTLLWFTSLILLSGWTGASLHQPYFTWISPSALLPHGGVVDIQQHGSADAWHPSESLQRRSKLLSTHVRVHGHEAHHATQILAGVSAGLAGIEFVLYGITLIVFIANLIRPGELASTEDSHPNSDTDIEVSVSVSPPPSLLARQETLLHSPTRQIAARILSGPTRPAQPAIARSACAAAATAGAEGGNDASSPSPSPSPSQPREWSREAEMAARTGVQPPTPVMKALLADEREKVKQRQNAGNMMVLDDINPLLTVSDSLALDGSGSRGMKGEDEVRERR